MITKNVQIFIFKATNYKKNKLYFDNLIHIYIMIYTYIIMEFKHLKDNDITFYLI